MRLPDIFYKFTTANTALCILESGRLRWSSPLLFNDLSEFQRMPRFEPTVAESYPRLAAVLVNAAFGDNSIDENRLAKSSRYLLGMICQLRNTGIAKEELIAELTLDAPHSDEQIATVLRATFDAFDLETARVLCVTTEFDNEAMWANYAENHAGCVLGFRHLPHLDTPLLAAQRVIYTESLPVVGSGLDFLLYGDTPDLRKRTLDAVCCTKKSVWSYEREWRVFAWQPHETGARFADYRFYPEELESVTLGPRTPQQTEALLQSLITSKYPQCKLFRLAIKHGSCSRIKL